MRDVPYLSVAQERMQERIVEETDVPASHVKEEIIEVVKRISHERVPTTQ